MYIQGKSIKTLRLKWLKTLTACMLMSVLLFASLYTGKIVYAGNSVPLGFNLDFSTTPGDRETTGISWKKIMRRVFIH